MNDLNITKEWDFDAGRLPLDFANTVEWHAGDHPDDHLENYTDLVSWSQGAGLLSEVESQSLLAKAKRHQREARKAYKKAVELRETIYRIFSAIAAGGAPENVDLIKFNRVLGNALKKSAISSTLDGFEWTWQTNENSFDRMLWPIAQETANLLTSKDVARVGECADDRGCGYLFFDTSRNHSRRWCSMENCGNRAKAQRHYQRKLNN
jgi:predicted RNA-binding Zn ribbon-like protein